MSADSWKNPKLNAEALDPRLLENETVADGGSRIETNIVAQKKVRHLKQNRLVASAVSNFIFIAI